MSSGRRCIELAAWPLAVVRAGSGAAGIVMRDVSGRFAAPFVMPSGRRERVLLTLEHLLGTDAYLQMRGLGRAAGHVHARRGSRANLRRARVPAPARDRRERHRAQQPAGRVRRRRRTRGVLHRLRLDGVPRALRRSPRCRPATGTSRRRSASRRARGPPTRTSSGSSCCGCSRARTTRARPVPIFSTCRLSCAACSPARSPPTRSTGRRPANGSGRCAGRLPTVA